LACRHRRVSLRSDSSSPARIPHPSAKPRGSRRQTQAPIGHRFHKQVSEKKEKDLAHTLCIPTIEKTDIRPHLPSLKGMNDIVYRARHRICTRTMGGFRNVIGSPVGRTRMIRDASRRLPRPVLHPLTGRRLGRPHRLFLGNLSNLFRHLCLRANILTDIRRTLSIIIITTPLVAATRVTLLPRALLIGALR
jgi:hypothetical protein